MSRRSLGVGVAGHVFVLLCALAPLLSTGLRGETVSAVPCAESLPAQRFSRTELFLGLSKPDGALVTDGEFRSFVDAQVTPRFPQGLRS